MKTKLHFFQTNVLMYIGLAVLFIGGATFSGHAANPSPYVTVKVTDTTNHAMGGVTVYMFDVSVSGCVCNAAANQCQLGSAASAVTNWQGKAQINGSALIPNHEYVISLSPHCAFRPNVTACTGLDLVDCQFTAGINTHVITNQLGGINKTITFRDVSLRLDKGTVSDNVSAFPLSIYPNPASEQISFDVSNFSGNVQLSIINSIGQTVMSETATISGDTHPADVSFLSRGIYKVIISDNTNISSGTFIK
jgi:hypothetical protein